MTLAARLRILRRRADLLCELIRANTGDGSFARVTRRHDEEEPEQVETCIQLLEEK